MPLNPNPFNPVLSTSLVAVSMSTARFSLWSAEVDRIRVKANSNFELGAAICYVNVESCFLTIIKHIAVPSSKLEFPLSKLLHEWSDMKEDMTDPVCNYLLFPINSYSFLNHRKNPYCISSLNSLIPKCWWSTGWSSRRECFFTKFLKKKRIEEMSSFFVNVSEHILSNNSKNWK